MTTYELLEQAKANAIQHRDATAGPAPREFALAITYIEEAQMRYTRGVLMSGYNYRPVDPEAQQNA